MPNLWVCYKQFQFRFQFPYDSPLPICTHLPLCVSPSLSLPLSSLYLAELLSLSVHQLSHQSSSSWRWRCRRQRPWRRWRSWRRQSAGQWRPGRLCRSGVHELNSLVGDTHECDACASVFGCHAHNHDRPGAAATASVVHQLSWLLTLQPGEQLRATRDLRSSTLVLMCNYSVKLSDYLTIWPLQRHSYAQRYKLTIRKICYTKPNTTIPQK